MPRYVTRPRADADADYWEGDRREPIPIVDMHEPVRTGLLDANGDDIWRLPRPIGFGRDDDW